DTRFQPDLQPARGARLKGDVQVGTDVLAPVPGLGEAHSRFGLLGTTHLHIPRHPELAVLQAKNLGERPRVRCTGASDINARCERPYSCPGLLQFFPRSHLSSVSCWPPPC